MEGVSKAAHLTLGGVWEAQQATNHYFLKRFEKRTVELGSLKLLGFIKNAISKIMSYHTTSLYHNSKFVSFSY